MRVGLSGVDLELTGALDIFGLPHLLRAAEVYRKSFSLEVLHPAARAGICLQDGQIFWARVGKAEGEEVIHTVCSWQGADFWVYPLSAAVPMAETIGPSEYFERFPEFLSSSTPAIPSDEAKGEYGVFGLREILHVFRFSGRPATLRVTNSQGRGEVQVSTGLVLLARWGALEGAEALEALLEQKNGTLDIHPGSPAGLDNEPIDLGPILGLDEAGNPDGAGGHAGQAEEIERETAEDDDEPIPEASAHDNEETRTFKAMNLPKQVQLARRGNTKQRVMAACSSRERVAMAVVSDRNFTMDLAEALAANPAVNPKVLDFLGSDSSTRGHYQVAHNIVSNPATPPDTAVELLPRLSDRDLRLITQNGFTHAQVIRSKAQQILKVRKSKRSF